MSGSGKPLFDTDEIETVLRRARHDQWRTTGELLARARSKATRSRATRRSAPLLAGILVVATGLLVAAFA
jgi:hypothetical protein